jgi:hypothetical protein
VKTISFSQEPGWNLSFWFAVTSPLIGVLLAILALAAFQP